ncbi:putative transcriptional regulator medusa protein [Neofusicoccum parvum UCRNP2]|uniref:Putative transcriptional regulator medusa protein n=1 Tax=Botryosphaeria parva (strain UCR-NP2) TaxID=1287680 RepID=R1GFT1_BOTPV|nr:putative transcriptional regulator medusa protein [Neofusicoccum parvum UCRNP2]
MIHTSRAIPPAKSLEAPIIVDEDCDPSEPLSLQFGQDGGRGALAGAGLGAALLSMSGYEKTQEPYVYALHGAKLFVYIHTTYDLTTQPRQFFSIMFGNKRCEATYTKDNRPGAPYFGYAVATEIPPFDSTGYIEGQMPLLLNVDDEFGNSLGVVEVGDFTYDDASSYQSYSSASPQDISRDLDTMAEDWSREEWDAKRRLVQFRRTQAGSTITTTFKAVSPEDRAPHSICISCIWWAEKQECFVTSVDTIYLLESLVSVRFTVEEKNRIRRNLEGFRPLTVSKAKAESEEFFKVIMGFPNPKPRNIEKDVKVFPWKILAHALKKIIGKYVGRNASWDFATYIEASPAGTTTLPGGQALQLQRTDMGSEGVQGSVAGPEAYQQYGQRTSRS